MKKVLILLAVCLCLTALPVYAQEATPAPEVAAQSAPPDSGIASLFLLVGLGAVLLVGGTILARERSQSAS